MKSLFCFPEIQKLWLAALIVCCCAQSYAATLFIDKNFESGDLSGFILHGEGIIAVTTNPVASGRYAAKFDLINGEPIDGNHFRAEVHFGNEGNFNFGQEYWIGLNYRYEDYARDSTSDTGPIQVHTRYIDWNCAFHGAWGTAPFLMATGNDNAQFVTYGGVTRWSGPVEKQRWLALVVHFKISQGADGYIEFWKDGVKKFHVDGINYPRVDTCNNAMLPPSFNMGIYHWDWQRKVTDSRRRLLITDNLKIATGADGYSLVSSTPAVADTTPPVISAIQATTTDTTATVTWTTDEASSSALKHGLTTSYGVNTVNATRVTAHSLTITGLIKNTLYHYQVSSTDASNNTATSTDRTLTTTNSTINDTTPPVISAIQASATDTTITVTWTTDEASDSLVKSGTTTAYGVNTSNATRVTAHNLVITGLAANTLYHFQVSSTDASNNTATSADQSKMTQTAADTTAPVIVGILASVTATTATITWTTDEASDSLARYGFNSSYGAYKNSAERVTAHSLTLSGLNPATIYHFQVSSTDASNNAANSSDQILTTSAGTTTGTHGDVNRPSPCH